MSALATQINISGVLQAVSGGSLNYAPPQISNTTPVGQEQIIALTTEWTEITLPPGSTWFAVQPPPNNTTAISHKWLSADTGSLINSQTGIQGIGVDPSQLSFRLMAAGNIGVTVWSA
jgi:hypothetical protein